MPLDMNCAIGLKSLGPFQPIGNPPAGILKPIGLGNICFPLACVESGSADGTVVPSPSVPFGSVSAFCVSVSSSFYKQLAIFQF